MKSAEIKFEYAENLNPYEKVVKKGIADDLLKALQKMVERIEYYASLKETKQPNIEDWAYTYNSGDMDDARAAISKALGEE